MVTDPIADFIIRIKNGSDARKESLVFPYSKLKEAIAHVLVKEGYIKSVAKKGKKVNKFLEVELVYGDDKKPRVQGIERVSKLSRRIYTRAADLRTFRSGYGNIILSTPKGILTEVEAKKANVGGEVLFKIW
jgi:small subunit ribosomal protein S8